MVQIESKGERSFIHGIADEDGFGMEDNDEVQVYCVMNDNLEVVKPFGPGK